MTTDNAFVNAIPRAPGASSSWGMTYGRHIKQILRHAAEHAPRSVQKSLGPSEIGAPCLSGETEVVTALGIRKIRELAKDGDAELIVPLLYNGSDTRKKWGKLSRVPVEYFGEQELFEVTLRRNQETKIVFATAEHNWFCSYYSGKQKKQRQRTTIELLPGDRLMQLRRARPKTTSLMPFAVAQGFVFGDGTKGGPRDHRPARLILYQNGKDEALLKYFPGEHKVRHTSNPPHAHDHYVIERLPRFWKNLPPMDESVSFLMSWLAGYFAADGCVTEDGHCQISSARRGDLEFARSAAAVCGIGYGQIKTNMRRGISRTGLDEKPTALYELSLRRSDLPAWFFLTERHAERARIASLAPERDPHWIVDSVKTTGRKEAVYCAVTGEPKAFALADDLMTGNCHRQIVGKYVASAMPDHPGAQRTNHVPDMWPAIVGTSVHAWLGNTFDHENETLGFLRYLTELRVSPTPDHPGNSDLYDTAEQAVVDWKVLGPSSLAKIRSGKPPRKYVVQTLLYGLGCQLMGLPVKRVVIVALPRTEATLDSLYVWDHPVWSEDDARLLAEVLRVNEIRKQIADEVLAGQISIDEVPIVPDDSECYFCSMYRPEAKFGGPGCPGTIGSRDLIGTGPTDF